MQLPNLIFFIVKSIKLLWNDTWVCSGEKSKIYSPIFAMLLKAGMGRKGKGSGVFQYEEPGFIQNQAA